MESTDRLSLPLLVPGQAQKEIWHNEALQTLDSLVGAAVEIPPADDPPSQPMVGTSYLIGDGPTGDWFGHARELASFTSAGWRFFPPTVGLRVFVKSLATAATFGTNGWEIGNIRAMSLIIDGNQVVGPRQATISDPAGGVTIDDEARSAVAQMLAALRQHGLISL